MSSRPRRPLPSRNGWIVSNWTWTRPALMSSGRSAPLLVQEQFEGAHAIEDEFRRWRNEGGGPRAGAADPVLALPELARLFFAAPALRQKDLVDLADQPQGERKAAAQPIEAMVERRDVVRDFLNVVQRHAGRLVVFKQEQVGQRRLSALDLRREHRLLAHVGVDEQRQVRQYGSQAVEPAEGLVCLFEQTLEAIQADRWIRRQRRRDERPYGLLTVGFDDVAAQPCLILCCGHKILSLRSS